MNVVDKSGPAFPISDLGVHGSYGMSLRDYFAAKAMPVVWEDIPEDVNRDFALDALGKRAYEMADAMLAARENKS